MKTAPWRAGSGDAPRGGEAGQAMVEFVLILPILALMVLMIVDFGRVFASHIALANAAREGARYCALYPGDTAGTRARVRGELEGQVLVDANAAGTQCPSVAAGQPVTVTVRTTFVPITPYIASLTGGPMTLQAAAAMVDWRQP